MNGRKIAIFDLDDTLIFSDAKINIHDSITNDVIVSLTPSQFTSHKIDHDHHASFSEFWCEKILGKSKLNKRYFDSLRGYIKRGVETSIVTARGDKNIVVDFFKKKNVSIKEPLIYAVCDPITNFSGNIPERKKQAVKNIIEKGYNNIIFYDDNLDNLLAVLELSTPEVKIKIIHVVNAKKKTKKGGRTS
jgi:hypothetical protein